MSLSMVNDTAMNLQAVDELMCALLRGEDLSWPEGNSTAFAETFLERSDYHGVQALLDQRLDGGQASPPVVQQVLHRQVIRQAAWELFHQQVLTQVVSGLAKIGIQPVIFKGTALAYSLYKNPIFRERSDTDLIIPPQERAQVHEVLVSLGFERGMAVSGEFVSYQASYSLKRPERGIHRLDLHWRINNSELLSRLFKYEELHSEAVPLPELCADAIAAGPVHALLLAGMHRAVHKQSPYYVNGVAHYSGDRLIWLYDIHLLTRSFTSADWKELLSLTRQKGLSSVVLEGLERAHLCFHTRIPESVVAALEEPGAGERVAMYLSASKLRQLWMNFSSIDSAANQLRFMRELVFPPAAYMRSKYPHAQSAWLPWLYARRALGGISKRLRM